MPEQEITVSAGYDGARHYVRLHIPGTGDIDWSPQEARKLLALLTMALDMVEARERVRKAGLN